MLKYLVSYWDKEKSNKAKTLTPITPILFFHGKSEWNDGNDLTMCFDNDLDKKYLGYIPNFDYILFDLNKIDDDKLEGNIEFKCAIKIMKNIHKNILPAIIDTVKLIEDFIKDKALGNLKDFVILMLRYLSKSNKVKAKDIDEVIEKIKSSELKEAFMTLEKELELRGEKKGMQKGMQKGMEEEKKQIAKKLKQKGMPIKKISEITGLNKEQVEKL